MTQSLSTPKLLLGRLATLLLWPIAIPAWTLEFAIRRWRRDWEFNVATATPYFILLVLASTYCLVSGWDAAIIAGLYVLTAMEVLALWMSIDIARGVTGRTTHFLGVFAFRRRIPRQGRFAIGGRSLYISICLAALTIYWFGSAAYVHHQFAPDSYNGISEQDNHNLGTLFDFIYYSAVTFFTVGYGDISPRDVTAKSLAIAEILTGYFIAIFLFGSYVSYNVGRIMAAHLPQITHPDR